MAITVYSGLVSLDYFTRDRINHDSIQIKYITSDSTPLGNNLETLTWNDHQLFEHELTNVLSSVL